VKIDFEKNMFIASELLSYCHLRGAEEYNCDMKLVDKGMEFVIRAYPARVSDEEMEMLLLNLNVPRQRDMEQDFWGLSGESENTSEMMLVGMMCDEAMVEYEDRMLSIYLKRAL
jgi:hypothetical protein